MSRNRSNQRDPGGDESFNSVRAYEWGMEQAWKDTARHRYGFTGGCGPHTVADPYSIPVDRLLSCDDSKPVLALPESFALAVLEPQRLVSFDSVDPFDRQPLAKATTGQNMILPLPLVDACVAAVGKCGSLTDAWLDFIGRKLDAKQPHVTVERAAVVIGTLLAESFVGRLNGSKLDAWTWAWGTIAKFVDITFFVERLSLSLCGERVNRLSLLRDAGDPFLRAALLIHRKQEDIARRRQVMEEVGWPPGIDEPTLPVMGTPLNVLKTVRPLGKPFHVKSMNPFYRATSRGDTERTVVFLIDRDDGKLKILTIPKAFEEDILENPGRDWDVIRYDYGGAPAQANSLRIRIASLEVEFDRLNNMVVNLGDACTSEIFGKIQRNESELVLANANLERAEPCRTLFHYRGFETQLTPVEASLEASAREGMVSSYFNGRVQILQMFKDMDNDLTGLTAAYDKMVAEREEAERRKKVAEER